MADYKVVVHVSEMEDPNVLFLKIDPERVQLDGKARNTITWTITDPRKATFDTAEDITFLTESGKGRFEVVRDSSSQITATVEGTNENQTIYAYFLTIHLTAFPVAIRVDPEVDNPPPPPVP
jgi:hypothetical protein